MRAIFSILSLVIVVAIVGVLTKKHLTSVSNPATTPGATPQQQSQQIQEQVKKSLDAAAQQRAVPDSY